MSGKRGPIPKSCKACRTRRQHEANKRWRERNQEHLRVYRATYYADPDVREYYKAKSRKWYAANAEHIAKYRRELYLERQQATNSETVAAYRQRNPGKHAEIENRRRARRLEQFVAPVDPADIRERDGGLCGICGQPVMESEQSLDHIIPISLGGTHEPANVQLAHRVCNSQKGTKVLSGDQDVA